MANYMRLLKLPREVMQLLAEKKINFAEAKELLKLEERRSDFEGGAVCGEEGDDAGAG